MDKKRKVDVSQLKLGNILANDIYNSEGILLARSGIAITEELMKKIQVLNLNAVEIYDYVKAPVSGRGPVISEDVREAVCQNLKQAYREVESKEFLDFSEMASTLLIECICQAEVEVCIEDLRISNEYTYNHSIDVAGLAILIGDHMKLSHRQLINLGVAGLLHDIGKTKISNEILDKPGKLTPEEFEIIKTHSAIGYEILKRNPYVPEEIRLAVLQHHEKQDGSGYPLGIKGDKIGLYGKILAIADVFDALVTERAYHEPFPASEAVEMIMGSPNHFDSNVLRVFLEAITVYPVGTTVCLSNGEIATVVKNYKDAILRPVVVGITDGSTYDLRNDLSCANIIIL